MNPRDYPNLNFSDEVFCRHDVQYRKLEMNGHEKLKLQVLGVHQSGIYCISFTDVADFLKDDQKTQNYGSQLQIYYPYEAKNHLEMVVAKIGSSWYRCLFLASISATEVRVFLIDYGIELVAAKENIRVNLIGLKSLLRKNKNNCEITLDSLLLNAGILPTDFVYCTRCDLRY